MFCVQPVHLLYLELQKVLMRVSRTSTNDLRNTHSNIYQIGNIASLVVQDKFKHTFGIYNQTAAEYANTKGWIVAIATAGAVFGCLGV